MEDAILSKFLQWGTFPANSDFTIKEWLAALVLILIVSFLWSTVLNHIIE